MINSNGGMVNSTTRGLNKPYSAPTSNERRRNKVTIVEQFILWYGAVETDRQTDVDTPLALRVARSEQRKCTVELWNVRGEQATRDVVEMARE